MCISNVNVNVGRIGIEIYNTHITVFIQGVRQFSATMFSALRAIKTFDCQNSSENVQQRIHWSFRRTVKGTMRWCRCGLPSISFLILVCVRHSIVLYGIQAKKAKWIMWHMKTHYSLLLFSAVTFSAKGYRSLLTKLHKVTYTEK